MAQARSHAVLLAAGEGSRLRPLTDHMPKPLLPIDGRAVLDTLLDQLAALGTTSFTIVTGYLGDVLRRYVRTTRPELAVQWVNQPERRGSAHALQHALAAGMPECDAFVCACDTAWHSTNLAQIAMTFAKRDPIVAMGLRRWPLHELPDRSCVEVDADGRVRKVIEKPAHDDVTSVLSGSPFYVFRADFWPYVAAVESPRGISFELADGLQAAIDDGQLVLGVEVHDTRDITTPLDLLRHNFPYVAKLVE